jgi:hypothetical protein
LRREASRTARTIKALLYLVLACGAAWAQRPQKALIVLPQNASAPLQFGAAVLGDALKGKGLQVNVAAQNPRTREQAPISK